MTSRCEPIQRRYTELCNRSGSPPLGAPHAQMYPTDVLEDYWEDSSVSLRSFHSWDAPSWLDVSSPDHATDEVREECKTSSDSVPHRARHSRYSFDANDYLGSMKARRCFPPPMTSCSTLSIKEGGRFVLKEMDADRPQGFFRAQRENGRLLLRLVLPEEDAGADYGNNAGDEDDDVADEDRSSFIECAEEGEGAGICEELEYDVEELTRGNSADHVSREDDGIESNSLDGLEGGVNANDYACPCDRATCETEAGDGLRDVVGSEIGEVGACATSPNAADEELQLMHIGEVGTSLHSLRSISEESPWATLCPKKGGDLVDADDLINIDVKHFVVESSFGREQGTHQQEPLWNVDMGLSPWSPKQLCLHQPIVNMRPVLGLAMS